MKASSKEQFKIISQNRVYNGFYHLEKLRLQYRYYDQSWSPIIERELFQRGDAAAVLLVDRLQQVVILVEQFRVGALNTDDPWMLDIVAGSIEVGHTAVETAVKETQEEAGIELNSLYPLLSYYPSPGACSEQIHLFYAEVDARQAPKYAGCDFEHEDIRVVTVPIEQALEYVNSQRVISSPAIISLQWLALNQNNLDNIKLKSIKTII